MIDSASEALQPQSEVTKNINFLSRVKPHFEEATLNINKEDAYGFHRSYAFGDLSFAIGRLLLNENPQLKFSALKDIKDETTDGIFFIHGEKLEQAVYQPYNWIEVVLGNNIIIVSPLAGNTSHGDSYNVSVINNKDKQKEYKKLFVKRIDAEKLDKRWYNGWGSVRAKEVIEAVNNDLVPYSNDFWWTNFRNQFGFWRTIPTVEQHISQLPLIDRSAAIREADKRRNDSILKVWQEELLKLPTALVKDYGLTADLDGWNKYLQLCYERENNHKKRYGFQDWSSKYMLEMLNYVEYTKYLEQEAKLKASLESKSFFEYYFEGAGLSPEIWWGEVKEINPHSVLVHSISENALISAVKTGLLGRGGVGEVALCQDRIVYDRGWIIIFQAKDLIAAGYPLLKVDEDFRDAQILQEWRSIPLDINLARMIVPTSAVPDRENASKAQIATSFFGLGFLKELQRI